MDKNQNTSIQMFADYEGDISTLLESNAPEELPVLATRNMVVFPGVLVPIFIGRKASVSLIRKLSKSEDPICAIFSQKDAEVDAPKQKDLYAMGVYAHLVRVIDMPGSENITAIFQAHGRCRLESITATRPYLKGTATPVSDVVPDVLGEELRAIVEDVRATTTHLIKSNDDIPNETLMTLKNISNEMMLINFLCTSLPFDPKEKMELLMTDDMEERAIGLLKLENRDIHLQELKNQIR